jgi:hypothetical protein
VLFFDAAEALFSAWYAIETYPGKSYFRTKSRTETSLTYRLSRRMHCTHNLDVALLWSNVLYDASRVGRVASQEPNRAQSWKLTRTNLQVDLDFPYVVLGQESLYCIAPPGIAQSTRTLTRRCTSEHLTGGLVDCRRVIILTTCRQDIDT